MIKLQRARSLLYRRQILQRNTRWKALDEIYKICNPLHRSDLKISTKNVKLKNIFAKLVAQITIFQHFARSRRYAILCTAQISNIWSKIVKMFAKLNIEYSIEIAHFQYEKCYFSSKNNVFGQGSSKKLQSLKKLSTFCKLLHARCR